MDQDRGICHDRYGYLEFDRFVTRSCTMCYAFLFPKSLAWIPQRPNFEALKSYNNSIEYPVAPDPRVADTVNLVCSLLTKDQCNRWLSCCTASVECCRQQLRADRYNVLNVTMCERTWDGYSCWEDTPENTKATVRCPHFLEHSSSSRRYTVVHF